MVLLLRARKQSRRPHRPQLSCAFSALGIQCVCAVLADVAGPCVCVSFSFFFGARAHSIYYFTPGCVCISTQQLVRIFDGGDWDKSYSSGIWDGKNDSTIGNEMISEWTNSGKWDGRKSVKVGNGNGMGSEWAASGTGREWDGNNLSCGGTGNAGTEISNGRGRETSVEKKNIATVPVPVPFLHRPDFYRAKP